jgi:hypothetical protein
MQKIAKRINSFGSEDSWNLCILSRPTTRTGCGGFGPWGDLGGEVYKVGFWDLEGGLEWDVA